MRHLIEEARYSQARRQGLPTGQAEIVCTCGAIVTSDTWVEHRGLSWEQQRKKINHTRQRARAA